MMLKKGCLPILWMLLMVSPMVRTMDYDVQQVAVYTAFGLSCCLALKYGYRLYQLESARCELAGNPSALHKACLKGNKQKAQLLLEVGADIHDLDHTQWTPLHCAAYHGHLELARLLIDHGACASARDPFYRTPLYYAAQRGHADIIELFFSRGTSSDDNQNTSGWTPLHEATIYNQRKSVERLLFYSVPFAQNTDGCTPAHMAVKLNNVEVMQLLLNKSFSVPQWKSYKDAEPVSLKERTLLYLIKNLHAFCKEFNHTKISLEDWMLDFIAHHVPLDRQQEIIKLWQEKTEHHSKLIDSFITVHCQRHLIYIQHILQIKNAEDKTVYDYAHKHGCQGMLDLLNAISKAEQVSDLNEELQKAFRANIRNRLLP